MATRIIEYCAPARGDGYPVVPAGRKVTAQTALTATGTSQQSAAFASNTRIVGVQSDEAVYVAFAANPTATTNDYRLQAGTEQFFDLFPYAGQNWKVAIRT
jgi:hypothetical protein